MNSIKVVPVKIFTSVFFIISLMACTYSKDSSLTEIKVDGDKLILKGTFDQYTNNLIKNALSSNSNITMIVFTENGGSINDDATLGLGRYIRAKGLNTHIASGGSIASGGLSLFLSGVKRSRGQNVRIGVHSWQHCQGEGNNQVCKDARDYPKDDSGHNFHKDYVEEMLGNTDFYWFCINAAASEEIHWLTKEDYERFPIFN